ncbi:uncharacterized protein B0J16DRAFT_322541 [Fusarium flagelliforme]|uniref:uncharacterized protein n=1 Tax=Fusarium flagelliforme TaxID=2675880 RepID=UPI001E8CEE39|nr:uncharacterized protein B0J16DRAFT_322541 [Fusarium flagelliforme]KAH7179053.1 hypothetical protein B0J16DRAFT_322541 [Fusarium flagelliforme]
MALESLPPELLTIILQNSDSLPDLHNLISASPACLRVFNSASKLVLPVVIRNTISTHFLEDIHDAMEAPEPGDKWPRSIGPDAYIQNYIKRYAYMLRCYGDTPWQIARYQLYKRLSYLITKYLARLKGLGLDTTMFTSSPHKRTTLQNVFSIDDTHEEGLHKALLRYARKTGPPIYHDRRNYSLFLYSLSPFDVENMVCLELYAACRKQGSI